MPDAAENPYSPPQESLEPAGELRKWSVSSGVLQVSSGAELPRIDLLGEDDRDLIPVVSLRPRTTWLPALFAGCLVLGLLGPRLLHFKGFSSFYPILAALLILIRLRTSGGAAFKNGFRVKYYLSRDNVLYERRFSTRLLAGGRLAALFLLGCAFFLYFRVRRPAMEDLAWFAGLAVLGAVVAVGTRILVAVRTRPYFGHVQGGWQYVSRVPHSVLARLAQLEKEAVSTPAAPAAGAGSPASDPAAPDRLVSYWVYPFRYPLRSLITWQRALNPLVLLITLMRRVLLRNTPFQLYRDSGATSVPLDSLPAFFGKPLRLWQQALAGRGEDPASWRLIHATRLESPQGVAVTETLTLVSPDLAHCLKITYVTQTLNLMIVVVPVWTLTTELEDGTVVKTSSRHWPTRQEGVEYRARSTSPGPLLTAHLAFLRGRAVRPAASGEQWLERDRAWLEQAHESLIAAGYELPPGVAPPAKGKGKSGK